MPDAVPVLRYKNRKMALVGRGVYVNLSELTVMVQLGHTLEVRDRQGNVDISSKVYGDIIAKMANEDQFTHEELLELIRRRGQRVGKAAPSA